jgi:hypothetical protein
LRATLDGIAGSDKHATQRIEGVSNMQWDSPNAVLIFAGTSLGSLLLVIGVVKAFGRNPSTPESVFGTFILATMCVTATALTWFVCWLAWIDGVMTVSSRSGSHRTFYVGVDPAGFWSMFGITYVLGLVFLALGIAVLLTRRSPRGK